MPVDRARQGCMPCPMGYFNNGTAAASCTACRPGEYANATGSTSCATCPGNTVSGTGSGRCGDAALISATFVATVAGSSGTSGFVDGAATSARFNKPAGIGVDGSGNVFVADKLNNAVRMITPAGVVSTLAGSGTQGQMDGNGTVASFMVPSGLAVAGDGTVYVVDSKSLNNTVRSVTRDGVVNTVLSSVNSLSSGSYTATILGIAADWMGNLYVSDTYGSFLYNASVMYSTKLSLSAGTVLTGTGYTTGSTTDGPVPAATVNTPTAIAATLDGSAVYYGMNSFSLIRNITGGYARNFVGSNTTGGWQDGAGGAALFSKSATSYSGISGIAVGHTGDYLIVADMGDTTSSFRIRKVTLADGVVTTIAGQASFGVVDGPVATAKFGMRSYFSTEFYANGVAVDAQGVIYVTDGHSVRKIAPYGCPAGTFYSSGACFVCPAGTYANSITATLKDQSAVCTPCAVVRWRKASLPCDARRSRFFSRVFPAGHVQQRH